MFILPQIPCFCLYVSFFYTFCPSNLIFVPPQIVRTLKDPFERNISFYAEFTASAASFRVSSRTQGGPNRNIHQVYSPLRAAILKKPNSKAAGEHIACGPFFHASAFILRLQSDDTEFINQFLITTPGCARSPC